MFQQGKRAKLGIAIKDENSVLQKRIENPIPSALCAVLRAKTPSYLLPGTPPSPGNER